MTLLGTIIEKFHGIPTACLADAMNGNNVVDPAIRPLKDKDRFVGRALTIDMEERDNYSVFTGMKASKPGDILVIGAKGNCDYAIVGDFMIRMMKSLAIGAIVIDGAVRDLAALREMDFPVFCKGTTPIASGRANGGKINVPIICGGTIIYPGDIIIGDADGIVAVPKASEQSILNKALDKQIQDEKREKAVYGNRESIRKYIDSILESK